MTTLLERPTTVPVPAPVIPPEKDQEEQLDPALEEFLEQFKGAASKFYWRVEGKCLRGYADRLQAILADIPVPFFPGPRPECPITRTVEEQTGKYYSFRRHFHAAVEIALSYDPARKIADATDGRVGHDKRLRQRLFAIAGVH